jgi:hypothetical protein
MTSTRLRFFKIILACVLVLATAGVAVIVTRPPDVSAGVSFNQGLETLDASGVVPAGWWRAGYGTSTASWWFNSTTHGGRIAQGLRITKYRNGDRKLLTSQTGNGLPVIAGRQYDVSTWYKTDGVAQFVVYRKTSTGTWVFWAASSAQPKSSVWRRGIFTTPVVPAGTVGLSIGLALGSNGTLITDDYDFGEKGTTSGVTTSLLTTTASSASTTVPPTTVPPTTAPPTTTPPTTAPPSTGTVAFADTFTRPDGLITNEYAFWNPSAPDRITDPNWELTSGSLFALSGAANTGIPDNRDPNATSSNGTDSAIFRALTRRTDWTNVSVSMRLKHEGFVSTSTTPAVAWDGVHVMLRYASEESLYYASVNRRDGTTQIKKKVPGGTSNGGTYYTLASGRFTFQQGVWQDVQAKIVNQLDGTVLIQLWANGTLVASAIDNGVGGPVIRVGRVGIRGDNSRFSFDDFTVRTFP